MRTLQSEKDVHDTGRTDNNYDFFHFTFSSLVEQNKYFKTLNVASNVCMYILRKESIS